MHATILLDNCICKYHLDLFLHYSCYSPLINIPRTPPTELRAENNPLINSLQLVVAAGMGPILALKYFRYTYRPSKINTLQQAERLGGPILSLGNIEPQPRSLEKEVSPLSITQTKNRSSVYEPLLLDSPNTRRSLGSGTPFDFFQSPSRLSSSSYSRNCKDNWALPLVNWHAKKCIGGIVDWYKSFIVLHFAE